VDDGGAGGQPCDDLCVVRLLNYQSWNFTIALGQAETGRGRLGGGMGQQLGGLGRVCDATGMHCAEFKRVNSHGETSFQGMERCNSYYPARMCYCVVPAGVKAELSYSIL